MQKRSTKRRGVALAILACVIFTAVLSAPSARACLADAFNLVLNSGELPGGG